MQKYLFARIAPIAFPENICNILLPFFTDPAKYFSFPHLAGLFPDAGADKSPLRRAKN